MSTPDPPPEDRAVVAACIGCPPCPGRGNDGHGMTHCAECCWGTGVEADLTCPVHGDPNRAVVAQGNESDDEEAGSAA